MARAMIDPPTLRNERGEIRRIGVEVEFGGVSVDDAAVLVAGRFGGRIGRMDSHRSVVSGTALGDFTVELDSQYAHPKKAAEPGSEAADLLMELEKIGRDIEEQARSVIGDITSLWLPVEIVSPPIPLDRLPEIDTLIDDLREAGAEGTRDGLLFAFATQLNPEAPSLDGGSVLDHLRSFLLLSDWLREEIELDFKRRLLAFADPFPEPYRRTVLDPAYAPSVGEFIDDYIVANPTRNRELDLLPLFAELDPERVRGRLDDALIKARPTFHYRLPDTRIDDPGWGIVVEWNRWVAVEQLAAEPEALRMLGRDYLYAAARDDRIAWTDSRRSWLASRRGSSSA